MAKINVYGTESYCTWICREPVEVDTDNYPELEGMTDEEIKTCIKNAVSDIEYRSWTP